MRRTLGLATALALLVLGTTAARADVKTSDITFKSGDAEVKGFLAEPEGKGPFPAIVVIQEWWGLTDWIKDNAKRFAGQGYVALAPDLYHGKVTDDPAVAGQLLKGLDKDRAVRDLKAAVDALAARDNVQKDDLGSIGWCMGGGYSLKLALADNRIKACVMCYGPPVTDPAELKSLNATLLGIFGAQDMGIKPETVQKFEVALQQDRKKVEGIREFDAGHGFMRPSNGPGKDNPAYNETEAKKAWQDVDAFFAKTLKGK
jgi:carboxymethylenebutenolidase